jgi:hypothetical protein
MPATGAPNRPISAQPEGQVSFRVVCGVAALAKAKAVAARRAVPPIPKRPLRGPEKIMNRL